MTTPPIPAGGADRENGGGKKAVALSLTSILLDTLAVVAIMLSSFSLRTIVRLDKQQEITIHAFEAIQNIANISHAVADENRDRLIRLESTFVPAPEIANVWKEIAKIKEEVIKTSLVVNPTIEKAFEDLASRLTRIEYKIDNHGSHPPPLMMKRIEEMTRERN
jgi:hypothetical protein